MDDYQTCSPFKTASPFSSKTSSVSLKSYTQKKNHTMDCIKPTHHDIKIKSPHQNQVITSKTGFHRIKSNSSLHQNHHSASITLVQIERFYACRVLPLILKFLSAACSLSLICVMQTRITHSLSHSLFLFRFYIFCHNSCSQQPSLPSPPPASVTVGIHNVHDKKKM